MAISNTREAFLAGPYDGYTIDTTADTALAAITTSSTVRDVLDILNGVVQRNRVTTVDSTGYATSVQV